MNKIQQYFKGDELAIQVWNSKYRLKDKKGNYVENSVEERFRAIANEIERVLVKQNYSKAKGFSDIIFNKLIERKIIFGGSILYGVANPYSNTSLANCFVTSLAGEDSYGSIMRADEELVQIAKRRGGDGLDLSVLRPRGFSVNNAAGTSTGAVSFAHRFSNSSREVAQDGRRGALMLTLHVNHPDILEFIDVKSDTTSVTGANISVKVSDEFIDAVKTKEVFYTRFPIDAPLPKSNHKAGESFWENNVYYRTYDATEIWNKLIAANWGHAEPGILFWDKIIRESPADIYPTMKTESTNPCLLGSSKLLTSSGEVSIESLADIGSAVLINKNGEESVSKVWKTGKKPVYDLFDTSRNIIASCTLDHKWMTTTGEEVQAKDLARKRILPYINKQYIFDDNFIALGFIQGDGQLTDLNNSAKLGIAINVGKKDHDILPVLHAKEDDIQQGRRIYTSAFTSDLYSYKFDLASLVTRKFPATYDSWSTIQKLSFLRGMFSANGSVITKYRVTYKAVNKELIDKLQETLLEFGIASYITTNKAKPVKFKNGTYLCKESYDLNISRYQAIKLFAEKIGFELNYRQEALEKLIIQRAPMVWSIKYKGDFDVYDFSEPKTHWGVVNGCVSHNCGELPLAPYSSCRLASALLPYFVLNPFTDKAEFDYVAYAKTAEILTIAMDAIVELEIEKITSILDSIHVSDEAASTKATELNLWLKIREDAKNGRRLGLSSIGHGDLFARLNMNYADKESIDLTEDLQKLFAVATYTASVELGEELGTFEAYNEVLEKSANHPFLNRIGIYKNRRNVALLTVPPSGSISIVSQISSGIEPVFSLVYKRRRKINPDAEEYDFVDELGDKFKEYVVIHPGLEAWIGEKYRYKITDTLSYEDLMLEAQESPYWGNTAADIDYFAKVKMQAALQKYNDHSVSVTHNLPKEATEKLVSDLFMYGYDQGVKGMTIYREGSRDGILISAEETASKTAFVHTKAPKRPKKLPCDIHVPSINGEFYIVIVGLYEGEPYEVFAVKKKDIKISAGEGKLVRRKKRTYDLYDAEGEMLVEDLLGKLESPEWGAMTKLISLALRHGASIDYVVSDLNKNDGIITDPSKVVARQLKKYIKDVKSEQSGKLCPVCDEPLQMEGGCEQCVNPDCGWSACK